MDRVVEFREKLIVGLHIAGGQPARGPEIMSVQHSNTVEKAHRNIFIEDSRQQTRVQKGKQKPVRRHGTREKPANRKKSTKRKKSATREKGGSSSR